MKTKKVDKKKTLAYAVAFYFIIKLHMYFQVELTDIYEVI